jgi:hypothetical protein
MIPVPAVIRKKVRDLMISIHRVGPDLVDRWISEMSDFDVLFRLRMYQQLGLAEAELSAAGTNLSSGDVLPAPVFTTRDDDGMLAALNCVPGEPGKSHARFGSKKPGPELPGAL